MFFLGNTGHELNNYGVRAYLADEFELQPRAVFPHFPSRRKAKAVPDGHAPMRLDRPARGAYSHRIRTAETQPRPFVRLLPGDGVGVGCVSPLHASTGRFQVTTTGR